jgi:cell division protein YceG involved in septum cleavage
MKLIIKNIYSIGVFVMKKLWVTHSYTILIILAFCIAGFFWESDNTYKQEEFLSVTIVPGDTVWELADQYSANSGLSKKQFINWVLTQNELSETLLIPGEDIILPVKIRTNVRETELASATGE